MDNNPYKTMIVGVLNLNDLPDNIIEKILTHLPIQDAAKTNILSKKWRNHWRNIPDLVFDDSRAQSVKEQIYSLLHVSQVFLFHRGSIHKFTPSIPLESCPQIDYVMLFLCDKDVHKFTFDLVLENQNHKIPSCLFAYQQLRYLDLADCEFEAPPTFGGFPQLISLRFHFVDFAEIECNTFIPKCPLLERLTIDDCDNILSLEIDAPKLKFLVIIGFVGSLFSNNTPLLSSVEITYFHYFGNAGERLTLKVVRFLECLPVVEYLRIKQLDFMSEDKLPTRLPITISYLVVLELVGDFYCELDLSWVLGLIISSPNLRKLKLEVSFFIAIVLDATATAS